MDITIKNFKKIKDHSITLSGIDILIGANNSGKSSFIQSLQFAVSCCQSISLKNSKWTKNHETAATLDSDDFIYSPTRNIRDLYHGEPLTNSRNNEKKKIEIGFSFENKSFTVNISKGKNTGFSTQLFASDKNTGLSASSIQNPFSVYVPGLAGIPVKEEYAVPFKINKSAARGDSNIYLRNILNLLHSNEDDWNYFIENLNSVYRDVDIVISFNKDNSEYIEVEIIQGNKKIPFDLVGTGLLQVIQIFTYDAYFKPKLLLLDEPDAHLHPSKQKLLATALIKINKEKNRFIVVSTHSRHILYSMEHAATSHHFSNGASNVIKDNTSVLIDIGAIDSEQLFSNKKIKYIIVTEDKVDNIKVKKNHIKKIINASGVDDSEFILHSYEGCSKVEFARILKGFVRKNIPTCEVILHFDRDQRTDEDQLLTALKTDCTNKGIMLFITEFSEIEGYYANPKHIQKIYNTDESTANSILQEAKKSIEDITINKIADYILNERRTDILKDGTNLTCSKKLGVLKDSIYRNLDLKCIPGKELVSKISEIVQIRGLGNGGKIYDSSEHLASIAFSDIISNIKKHTLEDGAQK